MKWFSRRRRKADKAEAEAPRQVDAALVAAATLASAPVAAPVAPPIIPEVMGASRLTEMPVEYALAEDLAEEGDGRPG